jgi:hypothetical protein
MACKNAVQSAMLCRAADSQLPEWLASWALPKRINVMKCRAQEMAFYLASWAWATRKSWKRDKFQCPKKQAVMIQVDTLAKLGDTGLSAGQIAGRFGINVSINGPLALSRAVREKILRQVFVSLFMSRYFVSPPLLPRCPSSCTGACIYLG